MQQPVQGAVAHELGDDAEELGLVADAEDLDDVVESGFVQNLGLLQQEAPLPESSRHTGQNRLTRSQTRHRRGGKEGEGRSQTVSPEEVIHQFIADGLTNGLASRCSTGSYSDQLHQISIDGNMKNKPASRDSNQIIGRLG